MELLKRDPELVLSVSATTRPPRAGEKHGKDYYFLSREDFLRRVENREFVEYAKVHGYLYGTMRSELERHLESGKDVLLQVDVQGMRGLKNAGVEAVTVFIMPPSLEELRKRLNRRGTESDTHLALRLDNASREMEAQGDYDYVVVNDMLSKAVEEAYRIILDNRDEN